MIRPITAADREIYLQMAREFYNSEAVLHSVDESHFSLAFDEMMRSGDYLQGLIFQQGNEIAGYVQLARTWSQEAGGSVVWIEEIYLRPAFRGRGLAREFFSRMRELAPAARYRLEIEPDNIRAEKLYRSVGFEPLLYSQLVMDMGPEKRD